MLVEAMCLAEVGLACCVAGLALGISLGTKQAAGARARRVAERTIREVLGNRLIEAERNIRRLERDELVTNRVLNIHGLMRGRMVLGVEDRAETAVVPYRPVDRVDAA